MKHTPFALARRPRSSLSAFTLVELLAVICIIILMMALVVPAVSTILKGSQLTQASQMLLDQLNYARQVALARNHMVEVRFYKYADPSIPGESVSSPTSWRFQAFQVFEIMPTGSITALGKIQRLPSSIIMDSGSTLSSLFSTSRPQVTSGISIPISGPGTNYSYYYMRFKTGGATDLDPTLTWFITVHNQTDGDARTSSPPNFATINIDPVSGSVGLFRP